MRVGYSYQLANQNPVGPGEDLPFRVSVDIVGDDLIRDDLLASAVDAHDVSCAPGDQLTVERSLLVGQSLLDEDIGDDEIKVIIKVSRDELELAAAVSPIIRGRF